MLVSCLHLLFQILCTLIAALLHFFFLSSFCWVLTEAWQSYMAVTGRLRNRIIRKRFLCLGWGGLSLSPILFTFFLLVLIHLLHPVFLPYLLPALFFSSFLSPFPFSPHCSHQFLLYLFFLLFQVTVLFLPTLCLPSCCFTFHYLFILFFTSFYVSCHLPHNLYVKVHFYFLPGLPALVVAISVGFTKAKGYGTSS